MNSDVMNPAFFNPLKGPCAVANEPTSQAIKFRAGEQASQGQGPLAPIPLETLQAYSPLRFGSIREDRIVNVGKGRQVKCRCYSEFLRDPHVMRLLVYTLDKKYPKSEYPKGVTVHSYGAADGSEAYGLAMMLIKYLGPQRAADFRIVVSDIVEEMVDLAKAGEYTLDADEQARYQKYLASKYDFLLPTGEKGRYRVNPFVTDTVKMSFKRADIFKDADLMRAGVIFKGANVILARNILNHFGPKDREILLDQLYQYTPADTLIVLGNKDKEAFHRSSQPEVMRDFGFLSFDEMGEGGRYIFEKSPSARMEGLLKMELGEAVKEWQGEIIPWPKKHPSQWPLTS